MARFQIYYENADTDDPRKLIGEVDEVTMAGALQKASQYWEVPSYDLVAVQVVEKPIYQNRSLHEAPCETCGTVAMLVGGQCETCIRLGMIE